MGIYTSATTVGEARGNGGTNGSNYTSVTTVRGGKEIWGINGWFLRGGKESWGINGRFLHVHHHCEEKQGGVGALMDGFYTFITTMGRGKREWGH